MLHGMAGIGAEMLSGPDKDFVDHLTEFNQLNQYALEKNWPKVMQVYRQLPPSVQASKQAMTMRLLAAQAAKEKDVEYLATIDELRKHYPDDPMVDLLSIDAFFIRGSYEKTLEALDSLDKSVGGDPYIKLLEAGVFAKQRKQDPARDLAKKAVAEEPTLLRGYYTLIDLSVDRHDFGDTVNWLRAAEAQGVRFGDLTKIPGFADFVKSPQFKSWSKSHGAKN
jgi:predicted Zn-dependent protease